MREVQKCAAGLCGVWILAWHAPKCHADVVVARAALPSRSALYILKLFKKPHPNYSGRVERNSEHGLFQCVSTQCECLTQTSLASPGGAGVPDWEAVGPDRRLFLVLGFRLDHTSNARGAISLSSSHHARWSLPSLRPYALSILETLRSYSRYHVSLPSCCASWCSACRFHARIAVSSRQ